MRTQKDLVEICTDLGLDADEDYLWAMQCVYNLAMHDAADKCIIQLGTNPRLLVDKQSILQLEIK